MNSFGQYLTQNRLNGIWVTLLLTILAMILPVYWMALLIFSFITLRRGAKEGAIIFVLILLPLLIITGFIRKATFGTNLFFLVPVGTFLIYAISSVLHNTRSWRMVLSLCFYTAFAVILIIFLINPEIITWWKIQLMQMGRQVQNLVTAQGNTDITQQIFIEKMSVVLCGIIVACYMLSTLLTVLTARWWQARVFNPGGFLKEFLNLSLDRLSGTIFILIILGWLIFRNDFLLNAIIACMIPFVFVGVSVLHANIKIKLREKAAFALVILYVAVFFSMLFLPLLALLVFIGLIDCFYRFKRV